MFCPLKGVTRQPRLDKIRQIAVVNSDLPAWDVVPTTIMAFMQILQMSKAKTGISANEREHYRGDPTNQVDIVFSLPQHPTDSLIGGPGE